jgi:uncharacterized protein
MTVAQGTFVWYELMTTDLSAAEEFYGKVVGWRAKDSGMPGIKYTLFSSGETPVGGAMTIPPQAAQAGATPSWTGYVAVANVDEMAERVKASGGAVHHGPENIPGVGRFAIVADPHGAAFALFTGEGDPPPPPDPAAPGYVGWRQLNAGDLASAFPFYAKLFGWTKAEAIDMGAMGVYQLFAHGGTAIGGMMTKPPQIPHPRWEYFFNVEAADAAVERVKAAGGTVYNGPVQVPGGSWIAQCVDPQGAVFAVVAPTR